MTPAGGISPLWYSVSRIRRSRLEPMVQGLFEAKTGTGPQKAYRQSTPAIADTTGKMPTSAIEKRMIRLGHARRFDMKEDRQNKERDRQAAVIMPRHCLKNVCAIDARELFRTAPDRKTIGPEKRALTAIGTPSTSARRSG